MKTAKRTPWFPGHIKPIHPGLYETKANPNSLIYYSWWNGRFWSSGFMNADTARYFRDFRANFQKKLWRGLAFDPALEANA